MGAAALPPCPPCSTTTATAIFGFSTGAKRNEPRVVLRFVRKFSSGNFLRNDLGRACLAGDRCKRRSGRMGGAAGFVDHAGEGAPHFLEYVGIERDRACVFRRNYVHFPGLPVPGLLKQQGAVRSVRRSQRRSSSGRPGSG